MELSHATFFFSKEKRGQKRKAKRKIFFWAPALFSEPFFRKESLGKFNKLTQILFFGDVADLWSDTRPSKARSRETPSFSKRKGFF